MRRVPRSSPDCRAERPGSPLSSENRLATCQQCHPGAVRNFSEFNPHANYKDAKSFPRLHSIHVWIEIFTITVLLFFMVHAVLWILRSLVHVLQHGGREQTSTDDVAIIRFSKPQLVLRFVIMFAMLGLAITGLLIKYADYRWSQIAAGYLGGLVITGYLHRAFGVLMLVGTAAYVVWLLRLKKQSGPRDWKAALIRSRLPHAQPPGSKGTNGDAPLVRGTGAQAHV